MEKTKTIQQKFLSAQKDMGAVLKSKENPFLKSKYADINAYIEVIKHALNENGLTITQVPTVVDGRQVLHLMVQDADSDSTLTLSTMLIPENADLQKFGASLTYLRRYQVQAYFFMQAEDDETKVTAKKEVAKPTAPRSQLLMTLRKLGYDLKANTAEDNQAKVMSLTGIELTDANIPAIIEKVNVIISDRTEANQE